MKKLKKWQKFLLIIVAALVVVIAGGLIYLRTSIYPASETALTASQESQESSAYYYFPAADDSQTTIIFYQGALVDAASYSVWAEQVAQAGYNVYLLKLPFALAVLGENRPQEIIEAQPEQTYILAGHSLGGVMASRFANQHASEISGMIFLASYPDEKGSLETTSLPVLSLTASDDGVLNWDNYQTAKDYLPETTDYETITGGNHAGFGSYGEQKGDNAAEISNAQQQDEIAAIMIQWLEKNFPTT